MSGPALSDVSSRRRVLLAVVGVLQLALFVAAQVDLTRRSHEQVRGSKTRWRLLAFINGIGPLSYFVWGRQRR